MVKGLSSAVNTTTTMNLPFSSSNDTLLKTHLQEASCKPNLPNFQTAHLPVLAFERQEAQHERPGALLFMGRKTILRHLAT